MNPPPPTRKKARDGAEEQELRELLREGRVVMMGAIRQEKVARVIEHALFAARPRMRYPVGPDARIDAWPPPARP